MTPILRFPQFKAAWHAKHGGDAFKSRRQRAQEGLPLYSVTIEHGMVRRDTLEREFASNSPDEANLRVFKDDHVYNMMRMWQGAVGRAPEECMVSPAYVVLQPKPGIIPAFFDHWFKRRRSLHLLWAYSYGLTNDRLRLYARDFGKVPMILPEAAEQQKIADFLSAVSLRISLLQRRRDALVQYKAGVMQRLFERSLRFTRDDETQFADWTVAKLGNVFTERRQRGNPSGELLSVTLGRGVRKASEVARVNEASEDRSNYKAVRIGDIAYNSMRMWQGASGVSIYDGIVSPAYTVIRTVAGHDPRFWGFYFKYRPVIHLFQRYSQGLTSDTWSLKFPTFAEIKLPFPELDEQRKIADCLSALDESISAVSCQVTQMQTFKKGLLQQMFL